MEKQKISIWTKDFTLLCVIGFFITAVQLLLSSVISLYVVYMGGMAQDAGALSMAFAIAAILMRFLGGSLSDKRGKRFTMVLGSSIYLIGVLGFMLAPKLLFLFVFRALQGIGFSLVNTASGAAVSDVVPKQRMGEGMGYYGLGQAIAMALGPIIGLKLIGNDNNYIRLFLVVAGIMLVTAIFSWCITYERTGKGRTLVQTVPAGSSLIAKQKNPANLFPGQQKPEAATKAMTARSKSFANPLEKTALAPAGLQALLTLGQASLTGFFTLFAVSRGMENAGMFFAIQAIIMFVTRIFTGKIADRKGTLQVVIPGMLSGIAGYMLLILAANNNLLLLAGLFNGICIGMVQPALTALAVKRAPADRRGAANATYFLGMDIANGVGGYLWGSLIDASGYTPVFAGGALLLVIDMIFSVILLRKEQV